MLRLRLLGVIIIVNSVHNVVTSTGDKSQIYVRCLENCQKDSCKKDGNFKVEPSLDLQLLQWSCKDDCKYVCMWKTVEFFSSHGLAVPQFHGKWPFVRIFGLQEPASVVFSLLNLYAHVTMYMTFQKTANRKTPMFYVWSYFTLVCCCGWFWSAVFHSRDTDFTEVMDYSFAFATVLTLFFSLIMRMIYKQSISFKSSAVVICGYLSVLYTHMSHLWSGRINYDYNMTFNVVIGFLTFLASMYWWYLNSKKLPHTYNLGWFTILTVASTLLELADFPPFLWTFDAHSLWHASTFPLVKFLYRFIIADCIHLRNYYLKLNDRLTA